MVETSQNGREICLKNCSEWLTHQENKNKTEQEHNKLRFCLTHQMSMMDTRYYWFTEFPSYQVQIENVIILQMTEMLLVIDIFVAILYAENVIILIKYW